MLTHCLPELNSLWLGSNVSGYDLNMDDFCFTNATMSQAEIQYDYTNPFGSQPIYDIVKYNIEFHRWAVAITMERCWTAVVTILMHRYWPVAPSQAVQIIRLAWSGRTVSRVLELPGWGLLVCAASGRWYDDFASILNNAFSIEMWVKHVSGTSGDTIWVSTFATVVQFLIWLSTVPVTRISMFKIVQCLSLHLQYL